jgi:hypothetical protein
MNPHGFAANANDGTFDDPAPKPWSAPLWKDTDVEWILFIDTAIQRAASRSTPSHRREDAAWLDDIFQSCGKNASDRRPPPLRATVTHLHIRFH